MDNNLLTWSEILRAHLDECSDCRRDLLNLCPIGDVIRKFAGTAQIEQLHAAYAEVSR